MLLCLNYYNIETVKSYRNIDRFSRRKRERERIVYNYETIYYINEQVSRYQNEIAYLLS